MKSFLVGAVAAAAAFVVFAGNEASARFSPEPIAAPALVEQAACTMRRERVTRPGGRVIHRTVRRCTPDIRPRERCRVVRERITRPNGNVVVRTVRRCR
jgi:hypothetical protein